MIISRFSTYPKKKTNINHLTLISFLFSYKTIYFNLRRKDWNLEVKTRAHYPINWLIHMQQKITGDNGVT